MIPEDSPFKSGRAGVLQETLQWVAKTDHEWLLHGADKVHTGWMPFQPAEFLAIMAECVAEADGPRFLDVGCGPGTKLRLAQEFFGLSVSGLERDGKMLAAAVHNVRSANFSLLDALEFPNYNLYDIIWMYRPIKDPDLQRELERKVYASAKHGAIVAGGGLEHYPETWLPIMDDWELRRGAWKKPL